MNSALSNIASRLTSAKGNHPALWLVIGVVSLVSVIGSVFEGSTLVPVPRLWRALQGMSLPKFQEVHFDAEPMLFTGWIAASMTFGAACLLIGGAGFSLRARARKEGPRFRAIFGE